MTIKGDMEVMVRGFSPLVEGSARRVTEEVLDWMTDGDVLRVIERADVNVNEWIAGVNALREKCL